MVTLYVARRTSRSGDRLVEPRQVIGTEGAVGVIDIQEQVAGQQLASGDPRAGPHPVGGQRAGPVAADLEPVHHERDLGSELGVAAHGQQRGRSVDGAG